MAHGHDYDPAELDKPGRVYDAQLVRRLWQYVRPQRALVLASLALMLVTSGTGLAMVWIVKLVIDRNITPGDYTGFGTLLAAFCALALVEVVCRGIQTWTVDLAGQNALLELRRDVFAHLQRLSSSFYDRTPIGRLVGRVTTDVEAIQELFSSGVVTILGDLVFIVATVAILFSMSVPLTFLVLLVVPVLLALTLFIRTRVRATYAGMLAARSRLNAYLHEHVVGMPIVQMFVREGKAREGFGEINARMRDEQLKSVWWESNLSALTEMLGSLTLALILWYAGSAAAEAMGQPVSELVGAPLTLGMLFAYIEYMQRFFAPLNDLSLKYTVMQSAMTASERIFALLDTRSFVEEPARPVQAPPTRGAIAFKHVSFGYSADQPVLRDVSFEVAPGERVAIVGATGAGKTTVLKLLTRLYDLQGGAIELDGIDVREYALADLRRRVGIVPQDVFLFGGTLLENIRLGHPEIGDEEAMRAADRLHLDRVVARFPLGYREPVRERGANLSSGERQLFAFARVLAVAPPVLALDEATSNVDAETEHLLQEAVHELIQGRTSLVIAHRLSTIHDVDRILTLHKGELVEDGTHAELLAHRGVYWRLYQLQYQERDVDPELESALR